MQNLILLLIPGWIVGIALFVFTHYLKFRMEKQLKPATVQITYSPS